MILQEQIIIPIPGLDKDREEYKDMKDPLSIMNWIYRTPHKCNLCIFNEKIDLSEFFVLGNLKDFIYYASRRIYVTRMVINCEKVNEFYYQAWIDYNSDLIPDVWPFCVIDKRVDSNDKSVEDEAIKDIKNQYYSPVEKKFISYSKHDNSFPRILENVRVKLNGLIYESRKI